MRLKDLKVGDTIISKKATKWYQLINRFFNSRIKRKAIKKYGTKVRFPEANHTRKVVAKIGNLVIVFHWTFPTARFEIAQEWMLDNTYAIVSRYRHDEKPMEEWLEVCLEHEGSAYDLGQLLDMEFSFKRFFDFSRKQNVCSSGSLLLDKEVLELNINVPTEKALPCLWANHPEHFIVLNAPKSKKGLKVEPIKE